MLVQSKMAPAVVRGFPQLEESTRPSFSILDDEPQSCNNKVVSVRPVSDSGNALDQLTIALKELSVGQSQNRSGFDSAALAVGGASPKHSSTETSSFVDKPEQKTPRAKVSWRAAGKRRATVESDTFEPLDAVLEENSSIAEKEVNVPCASSASTIGGECICHDGVFYWNIQFEFL